MFNNYIIFVIHEYHLKNFYKSAIRYLEENVKMLYNLMFTMHYYDNFFNLVIIRIQLFFSNSVSIHLNETIFLKRDGLKDLVVEADFLQVGF